jgi:SAM-dependent methyltransferase
MRFRNKFNIDLFNNPLRTRLEFLHAKNRLEAAWYDQEAQFYLDQLAHAEPLMPMDYEFEAWFGSLFDDDSGKYPYDRDYAFFNLFPRSPQAKILELGSGNGCLSRFFIRRQFDVCSVDISSEYCGFIRKSEPESVPIRSCAELLPFRDKSFDIVTAFVALHHFNLKLALSEIHRVLKDSGKGVFIEPLGNSRLLYRLRQLIPISDNESPGGGGLQISELKRELVLAGFESKIIEFELFTRLERLPFIRKFQKGLRKSDHFILSKLPFLKYFARTAVIEIRKDSQLVDKY